jgi:hypothetical protein
MCAQMKLFKPVFSMRLQTKVFWLFPQMKRIGRQYSPFLISLLLKTYRYSFFKRCEVTKQHAFICAANVQLPSVCNTSHRTVTNEWSRIISEKLIVADYKYSF